MERLEKKCQSKEEITEEDFILEPMEKVLEPMEKVPKLAEGWCEEVANEEDKENQEEEAMEEETGGLEKVEEKQIEHGSVPYFR